MFNLFFKLWYGRRVTFVIRELRKFLVLPDVIEVTFKVSEYSMAIQSSDNNGIPMININPIECWTNDCSMETAIAHEAKHVEQFHTGRLVGRDFKIYWDGVPYASAWDVVLGVYPYYLLPWEVEAVLFENWFAREYGYKALKRDKNGDVNV